MTTKTADIKTTLVAEYLELSATKLNLVYNPNDKDDAGHLKAIQAKSVLNLRSNIAKMRQMDDFATLPTAPEVHRVEVTVTPNRAGNGGLTGFGAKPVATITDAQLKFYKDLAIRKLGMDLDAPENAETLAAVKKLSKFKASSEIDALKNLPNRAKPAVLTGATATTTDTAAHAIPDGIYGIVADEEVKCYEVSNGKAGSRWEGFIFLDRVSSDDRYSIRNRDEKARILAAILVDVEAAGQLAAHTLKCCRGRSEKGRPCRRTLSDTKNPYYPFGYGPDCGPRFVSL